MSDYIICPICGNKLKKFNKDAYIDTCSVCKSEYVVSIGIELANNKSDGMKILNLNKEIEFAINNNKLDKINEYCKQLLEINNRDFVSNYFYAYTESLKGNSELLYEFYKMKYNCYTLNELEKVINHIIKYSNIKDKLKIQEFISMLENSEEIENKYLQVLKENSEKEKKEKFKEVDDELSTYVKDQINNGYKSIVLDKEPKKDKRKIRIILILSSIVFGIISLLFIAANLGFVGQTKEIFKYNWITILSTVLFVCNILLLINIKEK